MDYKLLNVNFEKCLPAKFASLRSPAAYSTLEMDVANMISLH